MPYNGKSLKRNCKFRPFVSLTEQNISTLEPLTKLEIEMDKQKK